MDSTTLVTFHLETSRQTRMVELFGSWDNFSHPYTMTRDTRRGKGIWSGCHRFRDIVCDGDSTLMGGRRDGALKMGGTYWFYYRLDGDVDYTDSALPIITSCPLLPGQPVNVLDVPKRTFGDASVDPYFAVTTLNPEDKFKTQRAIPPKETDAPCAIRGPIHGLDPAPRARSVDRVSSRPFDATEPRVLRRRSNTYESAINNGRMKQLPALPIGCMDVRADDYDDAIRKEPRRRPRSTHPAQRGPVLTTEMLLPAPMDSFHGVNTSHRSASPAGTMASHLDESGASVNVFHPTVLAAQDSESSTSRERLVEFGPSVSSTTIQKQADGRPQSRRGSPVQDRLLNVSPDEDLPWLAPLPESITDDMLNFHLDYTTSRSMSEKDRKSHSYPSLWSTASDFSSQPSEADEAQSPNDSGWNSPNCLFGENELSSTAYFDSTVDGDLTASFELLDTSTYHQDSIAFPFNYGVDSHSKQPGTHDGFTGYRLPRHLVASDVTITPLRSILPPTATPDRKQPQSPSKAIDQYTTESTISNILDDFAYLGKALS